MNKDLIERIINIAIEEGLIYQDNRITKFITYDDYGNFVILDKEFGGAIYPNLIELITSKEFIEAFCKYLWESYEKKDNGEYKKNHWLILYGKMLCTTKELVDFITVNQAISIRDNTLEVFYKNLLA